MKHEKTPDNVVALTGNDSSSDAAPDIDAASREIALAQASLRLLQRAADAAADRLEDLDAWTIAQAAESIDRHLAFAFRALKDVASLPDEFRSTTLASPHPLYRSPPAPPRRR